MIYDLPKSLDVCGVDYEIRSDYRVILDILIALSDPDLDDQEKSLVVLDIFYPSLLEMPSAHLKEALDRCFWFINGGDDGDRKKHHKIMDWEQDFRQIVGPVNRVLGQEVRAVEYMHWWTFLAAYYEIGDCLFAQIIRIRDKKAKGKTLDKQEREFYRKNRKLVDLPHRYTKEDDKLLNQWV